MSNMEKRHLSHRNNMQHHRYLDGCGESFMDETDREVMSLTDRAFRSLCIGDEAVYNDAEFSPSPVNCHKPLAEELSKRMQDNSASVVKKHGSQFPNGVNDTSWRLQKGPSKVSSLFSAFSATDKNSEATTKVNGGIHHSDSWDKSALLSIQRELSEFSGYQNSLVSGSLFKVKNNVKSSEKGTTKKANKDIASSSGKSSKSKHGKSSKLRKLNSKNFFLHSEFSPFQSWRDFNRFPFGQENISDVLPTDGLPKWYDSPLYKELTAGHRTEVPLSKEIEPCQKQPEVPQPDKHMLPKPLDSQAELIQPEIRTETPKPKVEQSPTAPEKMSQSEASELCAPWRRNKSRAKSAVPVDQRPSSPLCGEKSKTEEISLPIKKEVKTMEEPCSASSTPFSISQLLTPLIPSRQGTGTSEVLQNVLSSATLDLPPLPATELRPSPEIKRDSYKAIASSLLFNLKDNRKRVKAMYSPPKFKGLDRTDQSKQSPMPETGISINVSEVPDIADAKLVSPAQQKAKDVTSSVNGTPETMDHRASASKSNENAGQPDDYLALSLLQSGNYLTVPDNCRYGGSPNSHSSSSPGVNKTMYPSLNLYPKTSPMNMQIEKDTSSPAHANSGEITNLVEEKDILNKSAKVIKELESNRAGLYKDKTNRDKSPMKAIKTEAEAPLAKGTDTVTFNENHSQGKDTISQETKRPAAGKDQLKVTENTDQLPFQEKKISRKEVQDKRSFSDRQNNYIKSQRYTSGDGNEDEEPGISSKRGANVEQRTGEGHRSSGRLKSSDMRDGEPSKDLSLFKGKSSKDSCYVDQGKCLRSVIASPGEDEIVKPDALLMKGNTFAKRALFATKEKANAKTAVQSKKEDKVLDKYDLATVALEEVIAERERRNKMNKSLPNEGRMQVRDRETEPVTHGVRVKADDKQKHVTASSENSLASSRRSDLRGTSARKSHSQTETKTKHVESNGPGRKLAGSRNKEKTDKLYQPEGRQVKSNGRDRVGSGEQEVYPDDVHASDKVFDIQEKEIVIKNVKTSVGSQRSDDCKSSDKFRDVENEGVVMKKNKPEVPPRRGRGNSQGDSRAEEEHERKPESHDKSVKSMEMAGRENDLEQTNKASDTGLERSNVSALRDKTNNGHEALATKSNTDHSKEEEISKKHTPKDIMKPKMVVPEVKKMASELEGDSIKNNIQQHSDKHSKHSKGNEESTDLKEDCLSAQDATTPVSEMACRKEAKVEVVMREKEVEAGEPREQREHQRKSLDQSKSLVKDFLSFFGLSSSERANMEDKSVAEKENGQLTTSPESFKVDKVMEDTITVPESLGEMSEPSLPLQCHDLNPKEPDQPRVPSKPSKETSLGDGSKQSVPHVVIEDVSFEEKKENIHELDNFSHSSNRNESGISGKNDSQSEVETGGWVRCLIESASKLTAGSLSPPVDKPALFKVKDNTLNAPPIIKSLKVFQQKKLHEETQLLSPRGSLSGSERDKEDLVLLKEVAVVPSPPSSISSPIRSPLSSESSGLHLSSPSWQLSTANNKKGQQGRLTVPEEEERRSVVSTVSEGMDSCGTSAGENLDEPISDPAQTDDAGISKMPSERSGSACSGGENQAQGKPPVVPPKTEKALRRAMKLTTRRIQKESKGKSERKGRSDEKGANHKPERRHRSYDRAAASDSDHVASSGGRPKFQSDGDSHVKSDSAVSRSAKPASAHAGQKHSRKEKYSEKVHDSTDGHISNLSDEKKSSGKKQLDADFQPTEHIDDRPDGDLYDRLGRCKERSVAERPQDRRTQSLDRFARDKTVMSKTSEIDIKGENSQPAPCHTTPNGLPMNQNKVEQAYVPTATNIVTQSFPMTQRKLLQDPESGQYFVVDMPVQVKTKTFFDPETGSYVQLPVQSPEMAVSQTQSMEVVNAPPLVLYHGFMPVPVSSLISQSSTKTASSMPPPGDLGDFELRDSQWMNDSLNKYNGEEHPYMDPGYPSQDHTPEEELDSVR